MNRILCLALVAFLVPATSMARLKGSQKRMHAWDRQVGHRLAKHKHTGTADHCPIQRHSQVPEFFTTPQMIRDKILALEKHPDIKVELITPRHAMMQVYRIDVPAKGTRKGERPLQAVLDGWIHGSEPVGAHALPAFLKWATKNKGFRRRYSTTAFIKLDPYGARDTPYGLNLNRCFQDGRWTPETRAIRRSLGKEGCDVFVSLHNTNGVHTKGSWLVRGVNNKTISRRALAAMKTEALWDVEPKESTVSSDVCNCDFAFHTIGGVTSNSTGTSKWFMAKRGAPYSFTLETPNHLQPELQVKRALKLLKSTLFNVAKHGKHLERPLAIYPSFEGSRSLQHLRSPRRTSQPDAETRMELWREIGKDLAMERIPAKKGE